ncbi:hypothetical protein LBSG162_13900 [Lentilactobacillus buchneri subsp. silagei]|nr:hypothetical protein Ltb232_05500 [Lentilactobacillus buchneri subsp. silagei]GED92285.1 hypothetical protein LBSG162_13900 [Lentilactobacillus buchneri subsp. silagei]
MLTFSSPIQTLLSVPDSHWVNRLTRVTDFDLKIVTVGRELHPAPKKSIQFSELSYIIGELVTIINQRSN